MKAKELYGSKFVILTEEDILPVTTDEYKSLFDAGKLIFDDRYKEKFETKYID